MTEDHATAFSKSLQDFFALDDFNQIDKLAAAGKTNVYLMQDDHAFAIAKILADSMGMVIRLLYLSPDPPPIRLV